MEVWWEDVLETHDRRSARDPKTRLGVLHRRTHDPHARRKYCGQRSSTSSRLGERPPMRLVAPKTVLETSRPTIYPELSAALRDLLLSVRASPQLGTIHRRLATRKSHGFKRHAWRRCGKSSGACVPRSVPENEVYARGQSVEAGRNHTCPGRKTIATINLLVNRRDPYIFKRRDGGQRRDVNPVLQSRPADVAD
jgi:hypothetical protein